MFGPIAETIETQRLLLEPLDVHHADRMAEVLDDPRLHEFIGGEPLTLDELRARYAHLVKGPAPFHQEYWLNWVAVRRRDSQPVGYVQATVTPTPAGLNASVAWVIGMPYQGFGFATEAAGAMIAWLRGNNVTGVSASIHPDNTPSASVARKLGLHPTPDEDDGETVWRASGSTA